MRQLSTLSVALLLAAAPAPAQPANPPASSAAAGLKMAQMSGPVLAAALRSGGYVIYFRHAATDQSQKDTDFQHLDNCATQRNLSDKGRSEAEAIGKAVRTLRIPVGRVLSSPFCRARDTARLAFEHADLIPELSPKQLPDAAANTEAVGAALRKLLAMPPPAGTNTVLVAHGDNTSAAAGLSLAEGEAVVFQPGGPGGFQIVARVPADGWGELEARK